MPKHTREEYARLVAEYVTATGIPTRVTRSVDVELTLDGMLARVALLHDKVTAENAAVTLFESYKASASHVSVFNDCPALMPDVVAESVAREVILYLWPEGVEEFEPFDRARAISFLLWRGECAYRADKKLRSSLKSTTNRGRDQLYVFMRHWLAGWLHDEHPALHKVIPAEFANGASLQGRNRYVEASP